MTDALKETRMKSVANENETAKKIERKAQFPRGTRLDIAWQVAPSQSVAIKDVSGTVEEPVFVLTPVAASIANPGLADCLCQSFQTVTAKA